MKNQAALLLLDHVHGSFVADVLVGGGRGEVFARSVHIHEELVHALDVLRIHLGRLSARRMIGGGFMSKTNTYGHASGRR